MKLVVWGIWICLAFLNCGEVDPNETNLHAGINQIWFDFDGLARNFYVQLPQDFEEDTNYPVVFFFHGLGGNKGMGYAVMGDIVDDERIIGVYPQGYLNSWNTGGNEVPSTADDVGFTLAILDWLQSRVRIDEDRIYSMGYSNGGAFSYTLAMRTDRFAAIASLSASLFAASTIDSEVRKISVIQIHGEWDDVVPYTGGQSSTLPIAFKSALATVESWAQHDGLVNQPVATSPDDDIDLLTFQEETVEYEVRLYTLLETTHNIGSHPWVNSLECYREIWEFFEQHPKQEESLEISARTPSDLGLGG